MEIARPSRGRRFSLCIVAALPLAFVLALVSCANRGDRPPRTTPDTTAGPPVAQAAGGDVIFALLADNTLVEVSPEGGRLRGKLSLDAPLDYPAAGRYLGQSKDGKTLFALVPRGSLDGASEIMAVNVATSRVRDRYGYCWFIHQRRCILQEAAPRATFLEGRELCLCTPNRSVPSQKI
ncbi:MAG: hypothetical protein AB1425_17020, partial [Actinomycetota bacterium]